MMLRSWIRRLGTALDRARFDAELDEEIRTHLAMATEEYLRQARPLRTRDEPR
jgi:hypothetical protein